jgi:hypothetical protein
MGLLTGQGLQAQAESLTCLQKGQHGTWKLALTSARTGA